MHVVVTDHAFEDLALEREVLSASGIALREHRDHRGEAELREVVSEAHGIISMSAPISARVIEAAPLCRVIVRYGVGVDNVDLEAATARGIAVCNVPDYCTDEVADHTWMLALALVRRLPQATEFMLSGGWGFEPLRPIHRLAVLTVGVYGFGRIARAVARRATASGCTVIACDPYLSDDMFRATAAERVTPSELLSRSDVLCLHVPLSDRTRHLIDRAALAGMKRGAYLVNTARGGLVDTGALIEALDGGQLAGAALDVLEQEPIPPDHPLLRRRDVILTGHLAWYSEQSLVQLRRGVAEAAAAVLTGSLPRSCVNPEHRQRSG